MAFYGQHKKYTEVETALLSLTVQNMCMYVGGGHWSLHEPLQGFPPSEALGCDGQF